MLKLPNLAVLAFSFAIAAVSFATPLFAAPSANDAKAKSAPHPTQKAVSKPDASLLPPAFGGWVADGPAKSLISQAEADQANGAALKEYGFSDSSLVTYSRGDQTLKVKALRFSDASGAYGAYTFYRHSGWPKEDIGTGATSDNNRVLFWIGNVLIDAEFLHISAMSGSELRELAAMLPVPAGNKSLAPPILGNMPQKDLEPQTMHYALGPMGYAGAGGVLPPELIGFDRGAETVTANYKLRSGLATLTVINYPTPQMATAQAKAIAEYLKSGNTPQHPFPKPLQDSNPTALEVRRSGPLVAIVSGDPIQDEAHKLVCTVHYEAETANLPGQPTNEVQKTAQLIVGIITLVVVMFVAAVGVALFLGGGRALYRKMRGRPISSVYDEDFTSLDLNE